MTNETMNSSDEQEELKKILELQRQLEERIKKFDQLDQKQKLEKLFSETTKGLFVRIISDQATAAEFSAAVNLLKNNNISVSQDTDDELKKLEEALNNRRKKNKMTSQDEEELKDTINNNIVTFKKIGE